MAPLVSRTAAATCVITGVCALLVFGGASRAADGGEALRRRVEARGAGLPAVTTAELARWSATKKVLLLDVRARAEYEVSHLSGAIWAETEAEQRAAIGRADADAVVLYCSVGWRSAVAVERLVRGGVPRVYNLTGSIFQWANEGRPLTDGRAEVKTVHPYDRTWGQLLERRLWPASWSSPE